MTARILVVCTANICRSPAIAGLLRAGLPGVEVTSRGVWAGGGERACRESASYVAGYGANLAGHRSLGMSARDIRDSTLVLTAARSHHEAVLHMHPAAAVRTHALGSLVPEAAWLAGAGLLPDVQNLSESVFALTERLHGCRSVIPLDLSPIDGDLADPHLGGQHSKTLPRLVGLATGLSILLRQPVRGEIHDVT